MRAARWHGRGEVRIEEVPEPAPGRGEVKIAVRWCGICGTDLHEYLEGPIYIPTGKPHPLTGKMAPVTLGHEFSGQVVEVGEGGPRHLVGRRVTANACLVCGSCVWCRRGLTNLCASLGSIGLTWDGAFAEYVIAPAYDVYPLPAEVSDEAGAFAEPLAVAVHAVRRGQVGIGDTVGIVGAGPIGLLTLQVARAAGAREVYVVETVPGRARRALELGATAVFDPTATDVAREVHLRTEGVRLDGTFECVGSAAALQTAMNLTRRGGCVVLVGIPTAPAEFAFARVISHEKTIVGSIAYTDEFPIALGLMAQGKIRTEPLLTGKLPLADLLGGFRRLVEDPAEHVKLLVSPSGA